MEEALRKGMRKSWDVFIRAAVLFLRMKNEVEGREAGDVRIIPGKSSLPTAFRVILGV